MKKLIYLIFLSLIVSCTQSYIIDQDFSVKFEEVSDGFKLKFKKESIFNQEYVYEAGNNNNYIIVKTAGKPHIKEEVEYRYYIIDKKAYKESWGKSPTYGIFGPYDLNHFNEVKKNLNPKDDLSFSHKFD